MILNSAFAGKKNEIVGVIFVAGLHGQWSGAAQASGGSGFVTLLCSFELCMHLVNVFVAGILPTTRPPTACGFSEATCANGECIDRAAICDGDIDCSDRSDEASCRKHSLMCFPSKDVFFTRREQLM